MPIEPTKNIFGIPIIKPEENVGFSPRKQNPRKKEKKREDKQEQKEQGKIDIRV